MEAHYGKLRDKLSMDGSFSSVKFFHKDVKKERERLENTRRNGIMKNLSKWDQFRARKSQVTENYVVVKKMHYQSQKWQRMLRLRRLFKQCM